MKGGKGKALLDSAIAYTESSMALKDPFNPRGSVIYQLKNKVQTFITMRMVENEFVDFKTYNVHNQFKDIYQDLGKAYRRGDKVIFKRSLSRTMNDLITDMHTQKKKNPFMKNVSGLTVVQGRVYTNTDNFLPEDQWA